MPAPQTPENGKFIKVDADLGVVFGWAIVCTENGEPYYDLHNDHITEAGMLEASVDFMTKSQVGKEMHQGERKGQAWVYPITGELAKALNLETDKTGLLAAWKPDNKAILDKFADGTYTGFSIGGSYLENEDTPTGVSSTTKSTGDTFVKDCLGKGGTPVKNLGRKRKMLRFKFDELSVVDKGAQEGARLVMMKRADDESLESMEKLMFLTSLGDNKHQHSVSIDKWSLREGGGGTSYATADGDTDSHSHPWVITPEGQIQIGYSNGHSHEPDNNFISLLGLQSLMVKGKQDIEEDDKKKKKKMPNATYKSENGTYFRSRDYAYVPNPNDPSTWKLRLVAKSGSRPNRRNVGAAVTALNGPMLKTLNPTDQATVIRRVRTAWLESNPLKSRTEMPSVLKQVTS